MFFFKNVPNIRLSWLYALAGVGILGSVFLPLSQSAALVQQQSKIFKVQTLQMTTARSDFASTLLDDGRVLITGGLSPESRSSAEIYDPSRHTFFKIGNMNFARSGHQTIKLKDGKVLTAGGCSEVPFVNCPLELFDPNRNTFNQIPDSDYSVSKFSSVLLDDGRVVLIAGLSLKLNLPGHKREEDIEIFDPTTQRFEAWGGLKTKRFNSTAVHLSDGRVVVVGGGSIGSHSPYAWETLEILNLKTHEDEQISTPDPQNFRPENGEDIPWKGQRDMDKGDFQPHILGENKIFLTTWGLLFDYETKKYELAYAWPGNSLLEERVGYESIALDSNRVMVLGGFNDSPNFRLWRNIPIQIYDIKSRTYSTVGKIPYSAVASQFVKMKDGSVLMLGGATGRQVAPTNTAYLIY